MFKPDVEILYKMHPQNYNYDKNLDSANKVGEDVALRRRSTNKNSSYKHHQQMMQEQEPPMQEEKQASNRHQ